MQPLDGEYTTHRARDKVRIRTGDYKGQKGIVNSIASEYLEIQLEDGKLVQIPLSSVTNQSLAARKAWKTMKSK